MSNKNLKNKSVADEYGKKKFGRDKFKTEHSKELNSFYRSKRWVDENPNVTTKSLKAEIKKLQAQKSADETLIESNYGNIEELKRAKFVISKVLANIKYHEQEDSRQVAEKSKQETIE